MIKILSITFIATMMYLCLHQINLYLMLPEVHMTSSNKCVRVINYDSVNKYNCENLPKKYIFTYVPN